MFVSALDDSRDPAVSAWPGLFGPQRVVVACAVDDQ